MQYVVALRQTIHGEIVSIENIIVNPTKQECGKRDTTNHARPS